MGLILQKYTSFYTYDESFLADRIGYICTYVPSELQSGDRIYDNYLRFIRWRNLKKWAFAGGGMSFVVMIRCLSVSGPFLQATAKEVRRLCCINSINGL